MKCGGLWRNVLEPLAMWEKVVECDAMRENVLESGGMAECVGILWNVAEIIKLNLKFEWFALFIVLNTKSVF